MTLIPYRVERRCSRRRLRRRRHPLRCVHRRIRRRRFPPRWWWWRRLTLVGPHIARPVGVALRRADSRRRDGDGRHQDQCDRDIGGKTANNPRHRRTSPEGPVPGLGLLELMSSTRHTVPLSSVSGVLAAHTAAGDVGRDPRVVRRLRTCLLLRCLIRCPWVADGHEQDHSLCALTELFDWAGRRPKGRQYITPHASDGIEIPPMNSDLFDEGSQGARLITRPNKPQAVDSPWQNIARVRTLTQTCRIPLAAR